MCVGSLPIKGKDKAEVKKTALHEKNPTHWTTAHEQKNVPTFY